MKFKKNYNFGCCATHARVRVHMHTHTYVRTQKKTWFRKPPVPCENTVNTGISKLKGWPILELQYLGCKSMKLKKSNGLLESI